MLKLVTSLLLATLVANQRVEANCKVDIIFALDRSGSISHDKPYGNESNIERILNFTKDCIDELADVDDAFRFGVLTFANKFVNFPAFFHFKYS